MLASDPQDGAVRGLPPQSSQLFHTPSQDISGGVPPSLTEASLGVSRVPASDPSGGVAPVDQRWVGAGASHTLLTMMTGSHRHHSEPLWTQRLL